MSLDVNLNRWIGDDLMLGRKIGEGGNAEVFEWGNKVIKLAKSNIDKAALQREHHNALTAWKLGLPVARPYEIVEIENRPGLVFERIYGESLMDRLIREIVNADGKSIEHGDAKQIARLLSKIHQLSDDTLPNQNEHLKWQINHVTYLDAKERDLIIEKLDSLPVKNQICHGDPNPHNIFMENGQLVIIDWMDTTNGNPESDLAEFIIMVKFAVLPPDTPKAITETFDSMRVQIVKEFMDEYTLLTGMTYDEVDPWILPIAAQRLNADAISEGEKQLLLTEIRNRLWVS